MREPLKHWLPFRSIEEVSEGNNCRTATAGRANHSEESTIPKDAQETVGRWLRDMHVSNKIGSSKYGTSEYPI